MGRLTIVEVHRSAATIIVTRRVWRYQRGNQNP